MSTRVKVEDIKPNPFYARTEVDPEGIRALAAEIETEGLWAPLRGRQRNGHIELCMGHRRLEAVKQLGWEAVDVEVLALSDVEIAEGSLVENFQREDLNDMDKAEGVVAYLDLLQKEGHDKASARKRASAKLGITLPRLSEMNTAVTKLSEDVKEAIRDGRVALRTAIAALNHGGPKMAKTAAARSMALRSMDAVKKSEEEIEDPQIRKKVHAEVSAGKLSSPKEIRERVKELRARKLKKDAPSDLDKVLSQWRLKFEGWLRELEEFPYRDVIDVSEEAEEFRQPVRQLRAQLKMLL
jgi:ParB/RepB/Spo0J family partition protein